MGTRDLVPGNLPIDIRRTGSIRISPNFTSATENWGFYTDYLVA